MNDDNGAIGVVFVVHFIERKLRERDMHEFVNRESNVKERKVERKKERKNGKEG